MWNLPGSGIKSMSPALTGRFFTTGPPGKFWLVLFLFLPIHAMGFLGGSDGEESACNVWDLGSIPSLGRSPGGGCGSHCSILVWRIPMDKGAWWAVGLERVRYDWVTKHIHAVTDLKALIVQWEERQQVITCQVISSCACLVASVMSDFLWPYGLQPSRLLCPLDSLGKNTGVSCHFLLQGIFPTQGSDAHLQCLLHWQVGSLPLAPLGMSLILSWWN